MFSRHVQKLAGFLLGLLSSAVFVMFACSSISSEDFLLQTCMSACYSLTALVTCCTPLCQTLQSPTQQTETFFFNPVLELGGWLAGG